MDANHQLAKALRELAGGVLNESVDVRAELFKNVTAFLGTPGESE